MLPNQIVTGSGVAALKKHKYVAPTSRLEVDKTNMRSCESRDACLAVAELVLKLLPVMTSKVSLLCPPSPWYNAQKLENRMS